MHKRRVCTIDLVVIIKGQNSLKLGLVLGLGIGSQIRIRAITFKPLYTN